MVDILPSSVPRHAKGDRVGVFDLTGELLQWTLVYCASCGVPGPRVPSVMLESGGYVSYFCEESQNNCANRFRDQTLFAVIPDELFFAKMKESQLEEYGRELLAHEVEDQLHDPESLMSRLARDRAHYRQIVAN